MSNQFWKDVRGLAASDSHSNYMAGKERKRQEERAKTRERLERSRIDRGRRRLEKDLKKRHKRATSKITSTRDVKLAREYFKGERERALAAYDKAHNPKNEEIRRTGSNPENGDGGSAGSGGGVPEGYVELFVTICQDGAPVLGEILFKFDE